MVICDSCKVLATKRVQVKIVSPKESGSINYDTNMDFCDDCYNNLSPSLLLVGMATLRAEQAKLKQ